MENATDALEIAFAIFVFILAIAIAINSLSVMKVAADSVLYSSDKTNFYTAEDELENGAYGTRIVGVETIIPMLYRYINESITIKIIDKDGNIYQIFSLDIEGELNERIKACRELLGSIPIDSQDIKGIKYNIMKNIAGRFDIDTNNDPLTDDERTKISDYLGEYAGYEGATGHIKGYLDIYKESVAPDSKSQRSIIPWIGSTANIRKRIELFIGGTNSLSVDDKTINSTTIMNYGNGFLEWAKDKKFEELYEEDLVGVTTNDTTVSIKDSTLIGGVSDISNTTITYKEV
jgi:hypothetical protein